MATIDLQNIRKSYGKTQVIHGVNASIADGELIVIVGPSGCGKSTLLRMVAGLEEVTEGELRIDGRRVNDEEPKDRDIAMVFQTYALYPHMSVFDNMAYGLKIMRLPKAEIRSRVEEAARMLSLSELLDRKPKALSGGQRQRVAMGRAIVRQPSVFLFDEPLSNLDALLRVQMRLEIKQLQRRLGVTSLYVTHDQVEAMTLADRLIVMNGGVADQVDEAMKVYERPATRFVASFIGSPGMNFLNKVPVAALPPNLDLPELAEQAQARQTIDLGVRPENLALCDPSDAQLTLRVLTVETLGADTLVHGHSELVQGHPEPMALRLVGTHRFEENSTLPLKADASHWHAFDCESGVRLN